MAIESVEIKFKLPKSILAAMGLTEMDIEQSVMETVLADLYRCRQISLEKAAEIAEIPICQMNQILAKHDVWLNYTTEDAGQDWKALQEFFLVECCGISASNQSLENRVSVNSSNPHITSKGVKF